MNHIHFLVFGIARLASLAYARRYPMVRKPDPGKRDAILEAAREVFEERGFQDAHMSEIAERALVAAGTLYLYFESKEDLVTQLAEDFIRRITRVLVKEMANPDPAEAIAQGVSATIDVACQERSTLMLLNLRAAIGQREELLPADRELIEAVSAEVSKRMEAGEFKNYQPEVAAMLICGLVEWVCKACTLWNMGNLDEFKMTTIQILQNAFLTKGAPE